MEEIPILFVGLSARTTAGIPPHRYIVDVVCPEALAGIEMNFVVVASSPALLPLLSAVALRSDVAAAAYWSPDDLLAEAIANSFPTARRSENWDELLAIDADEAIICGDHPGVLEAARQLASVGRGLVLVLDAGISPARQFELSGVWQEGKVAIVPLVMAGTHAAATEMMGRWLATTEQRPRRIEFERVLAPDPQGCSDLTEEQIDRCLFFDAFTLRSLCGDFGEVTALRTGTRGDRSEIATVLLSGENVPDVTWTLQCGANPGCRIVLHGDAPTVEQQFDPSEGVTRDAAVELGAILADNPPTYRWLDLIHAGELASAAKTSAKKRRTIRLQFEESSERSQFKSQMTAVGCAVLTWALFGSMLLMLLATIFDPRDRAYKSSATHDFVLRADEFFSGSDELHQAGLEHIQDIARRWTQTDAAVIVEAASQPPDKLDKARRAAVVASLTAAGARDAANRVVVRSLPGQTYETLLRLGWLVAFIPLAFFLLLQALIIAARGREETSSTPPQ